ncbi:MAG: AsmA family protein [Desulfuromusa sp.]|nr:AsmA family protein [Desulfuromusa sp.]
MKVLFKLFIVLLVVVAVVVAGAFFYVDSIAKKAIEQGGEMALGVPTNLDAVHISLLGGEASLNGLQIANPSGFKAQTFMQLGQGEIAVSLGSLLGDTIKVPQVKLSNIRINLEQSGKKNNVEPILARAKSMSSQKGTSAPQPAAKDGKKFIIEYFLLDDVQVDASLDLLGQASSVNLVLPKIELRNLGAEEQGLPMPELIQKVVQAVLSAVQNSSGQLSPALAKLLAGELGGLDDIKTEVIGQATAQVEKTVKDVQEKVAEQLPADLPPEVDKAVNEKAGDLLKGVGGLLGGDKK